MSGRPRLSRHAVRHAAGRCGLTMPANFCRTIELLICSGQLVGPAAVEELELSCQQGRIASGGHGAMLTKKQHELLLFIASRLRETGIPPSFEEMKVALGLRSKSGIHRLMTALQERGFLKRLPHRARAVEILRLPDNVAPMRSAIRIVSSGDSPGRADALPSSKPRQLLTASARQGVSLPFYGKIAAGTPIEALRDTSQTIEVPSSLISEGSEYYALRVDGDSMIEAGILNNDIVIIERAETAENGTIVVALVNNEEVTLKRLRRRKKSIALEPANAAFETKLFGPDQVKVQGRLSALIRTYDYP